MTKEEKYLIKVHEKTQGGLGVSRYVIGELLHLSRKSTDHIVRDLMKANFLKKIDDEILAITENGLTLAKTLAESQP